MKTSEPEPGLYKVRLFSRGPWVPVRVWLEDGDRDESGELMSDQIWRGEWAPEMNRIRWVPLDVLARWDFLWPIDKEEFEWLIAIKRL